MITQTISNQIFPLEIIISLLMSNFQECSGGFNRTLTDQYSSSCNGVLITTSGLNCDRFHRFGWIVAMAFKVQFGYNRIQHDLGARNVGKFIEHPGEILLGKW